MQFTKSPLMALAIATGLFQPTLSALVYPELTVYNAIQYSGTKETFQVATGKCYNLSPNIKRKLKSIKIERPLSCQTYRNANCQGAVTGGFRYAYNSYPNIGMPYSLAVSFKCPQTVEPVGLNSVILYPQPNYQGPTTQRAIFTVTPRTFYSLPAALQVKIVSAQFGQNLMCYGCKNTNCRQRMNELGIPEANSLYNLKLDFPNDRKARGGEALQYLTSFDCNLSG